MKIPRISISVLMAVVAILAVDFASYKAILKRPSFLSNDLTVLILWGIWPMTTALSLGLLPFLTKPGPFGGRPGLVRFEVIGLMELLLVLAACSMAPSDILENVFEWFRSLGISPGPLFLAAAMALFLLPQLALAWFGAWLIGKFMARGVSSPAGSRPEKSIDQL